MAMWKSCCAKPWIKGGRGGVILSHRHLPTNKEATTSTRLRMVGSLGTTTTTTTRTAWTENSEIHAKRALSQVSVVATICPPRPRMAALPFQGLVSKTYKPISGASFSSSALHDDDNYSGNGVGGSHGTTIPFILADIGEGIAEVELLQWFVQEGDHVQQFDRICEVQSDKATVEITSRYDGRIVSLQHEKGEMVKVGTPLLLLESEEEDDGKSSLMKKNLHTASTKEEPMEDDEKLSIPTIASKYHLATDDPQHATTTTSTTRTMPQMTSDPSKTNTNDNNNNKVLTTPAIRKLAKEYTLDLSTIVGTGPKGRVLKGDVLTVLRERGFMERTPVDDPQVESKFSLRISSSSSSAGFNNDQASTSLGGPKKSSSSSSSITAIIKSIEEATLPLQEDTIMEIRGYNRLMVQSMTASLQIPHMVYSDEINVTKLRTMPSYKTNLPFLPFCIKAVSMALTQYPILNASYDSQANQVVLWKDHNIGIAMDTPRGLIVPVIHEVQEKSLTDIAQDLARLKECAKDSAVPSQDLQGATFTLSNIGAIGGGGTYMSPIVTSPQVAIGALGQIQRVPRFVSENCMEINQAFIVNVSWGGDHRVVDGATMARFHTQWKEYMENPVSLIKDLK